MLTEHFEGAGLAPLLVSLTGDSEMMGWNPFKGWSMNNAKKYINSKVHLNDLMYLNPITAAMHIKDNMDKKNKTASHFPLTRKTRGKGYETIDREDENENEGLEDSEMMGFDKSSLAIGIGIGAALLFVLAKSKVLKIR